MSESYTGSNAGPIVVTYTIPTDGDDVNAVSVNIVFQPNADNWQYAKRVFPDLLTGGTWTFTSSLTLSNVMVFNGDVSLLGPSNNVAGNAVLNIGLMVLGSPTVGTLQFNGDTASFIDGTCGSNGFALSSTTTNTPALVCNGNGSAAGIVSVGGTTGSGGEFASISAAPALKATASGISDTPAILCTSGGIKFNSYAPAENDLLPANTFAQAHFARCHGILRSDGAGNIGSLGQGINILSFNISGQFVLITLATSMANASFTVIGTFQTTSGTPNFTTTGAFPLVRDGVLGGTTAFYLGAWNGSSQINLATTPGDLEFAVFARQ